MNLPSIVESMANSVSQMISNLASGITDVIQPVVDTINNLIEKSNELVGTDYDKIELGENDPTGKFSGAKTTTSQVRENIRRGEDEPDEDVATEPNVSLNLEDSVENNVDVQADPEDKAQLSRITKDALEEANSFARRQQGGQ
jgi:hypothetical protein